MNDNDLKNKIKLAKEAVDGEQEPYKTEAFKIILNKLLESSSKKIEINKPHISTDETNNENIDLQSKLKAFAENCKITVDELNDIFIIKDKSIEIISPLSGSNAEQSLKVTLCILAAYEFVLGYEWVPVSVITECLKSVGVKDLKNLSRTLRNHQKYFRTSGGQRFNKYKLTTTDGRVTAFDTINRLAKGGN